MREALAELAGRVPDPFPLRAFERELDRAGAQAAPVRGRGLAVTAKEKLLARVLPNGTVVLYDPEPVPADHSPRRIAAFSSTGLLIEHVLWDPEEGIPLREARLRLPVAGWLRVRCGVAENPLWGRSDELARGDRNAPESGQWLALTTMEALPWHAIDHIPPVAEPARLPGGGGSVLLNFIAELLEDQGRGAIRYRGPYPGAKLFESLAESFALKDLPTEAGKFAEREQLVRAARERFTEGGLRAAFSAHAVEPNVEFAPRPFELAPIPECEACLFLGEGPRKAIVGGRSYVRRAALPEGLPVGPRRLWRSRENDAWRVGLWFLGRPLEEHGRIDPDTLDVTQLPIPEPDGAPTQMADPLWFDSIRVLLLLEAAEPLRPALAEVIAGTEVVFGPAPGSLARAEPGRIVIRRGLGAVFAERVAALPRQEQGEWALRAVSEIVSEVSAPMLGRAQQRLAEAQGEDRRRLLSREAIGEQLQWIQENGARLAGLCRQIVGGVGLG